MGSYLFDGVDDRIIYPDSPAFNIFNLTKYLVLAWVRHTGGNNNGRIFNRANNTVGPVGHMQLLVGNGANGQFQNRFTGRQLMSLDSGVAVSGQNVLSSNVWECIGFHFDLDTSASKIRLFEAGAIEAINSSINASGIMDDADGQAITVGNEQSGARPFGGQLAYIAVWNVISLNNTEIETIVSDFYGGGSGSIIVPRQDLLAEFLRLDASGIVNGDKSILVSPTIIGATYIGTNPPPVTYQALSGGAPDTDNFFSFI